MKKLVLIISLLVIVINSISAQFTIGPKVGLNISKEYYGMEPIDEEVDFRNGFTAGAFGRYKINDKFDIQTELLYSQQGFKNNIQTMDYGGITIVDGYKMLSHYLNIPVVLKFYPFKHIYVEAGPQVGFCLNTNVSSDYIDENFDINYNTVDFSLAGGIGVNIGYGLSVNARYNHGFMHTLPDSKWKNRVIQFSLSYDLWDF